MYKVSGGLTIIQGQTSFKASEDHIQVEDVEDSAEVTFIVPHSDASTLTAMVKFLSREYQLSLINISPESQPRS